jgi:tetratricopeptide (TPR) repeat protein
VKKWVITIAAAVLLLALVVTLRWWLPPLVDFAVHNKEKADALKTLLELIALPVGWIATVMTFIVGLWLKKKDDAARAGSVVTVDQSHAQAAGDVFGTAGDVRKAETIFEGPVYFGATGPAVLPQAIPFSPLHQLRPPPRDFVGRQEEIEELVTSMAVCGATVSLLQGQGGVGKTALALKVADRLKLNFPDAQISMDLLGVSNKPLTPSEAMAYVIRSFQPERKLPENEQELAGTYQSVLHGKRVLLLMDNASDAAQVKLLIPPVGCVLLVTSRLHFVLDDVQVKNLETLPPDKAEELLLKIAPRIGGEAQGIARLCGYLPQALRLAATALAERVNMVPLDYWQRLADEQNRPKLLAAGNESVEASISLSYGLLDAEAQKRWRMLGVFPESFDGAAAAAVWGAEKNSAEDTLGMLTQYSMLEWDAKRSRYRLHDLMRDFARQKLAAEERYEASLRHAQHYLEVLRNANVLYLKGGDSLMSGLVLFDLERGNIEAGQLWARDRAVASPEAAHLCSSFPFDGWYCLDLRQTPRARVRWLEPALAAARLLKDRKAEGWHLGGLGNAYKSLDEYRRAIEYYEQQLLVVREIGDRQGEGSALGGLGTVYYLLGEYRRAIEHCDQWLKIAREVDDRRGEGAAQGGLGNAYYSLGEYHRATEYYDQWLKIAGEIGDRKGEGSAQGGLGNTYLGLGEYRRAIEYYEQSLPIAREIGDRRGEGNALGSLGGAYYRLGEYRSAFEYYDQWLKIAVEIGDRFGESLALFNMSVTIDQLGDRNEAIKLAEASLKIKEKIEDPFAPNVRKKLEEWRSS